MDAKVDSLEDVKDSVQTFLSDLEAPDPVHPVVYSPYRMKTDSEARMSISKGCSRCHL